MQYKSEETYIFNINKELDACIAFKQELRDSGIPFTETGGSFIQTIKIVTSGTFDMSQKKDEV